MAEVFLAKAEGPGGFSKQLVLKRILPRFAEQKSFQEMFTSEARIAAQLTHPSIAQVFDFGEDRGTWFLAMEYVDGPNLRQLSKTYRLLRRPLPFGACARLIAQACEGLAWAHDFKDPQTGAPLHLVHRDISPDNLMLGSHGVLKVIDFGIARVDTSAHQSRGTLKGKFAYMAPEQMRLEPLDRRADVFSLGVCLYELLAGAVPTFATSEVEAIEAALRPEALPPISERAPEVPAPLQKIVTRALEKSRDDRYPDCRTLRDDLEQFLSSMNQSWPASELARLVDEHAAFIAGGGKTDLQQVATQLEPDETGHSDTVVRSAPEAKSSPGEGLTTHRRRRVIPASLTRLWGRAPELAAVRSRFDAGSRLVTLLGPGGTGKTRLSLAVCEELAESVEGGVVFVALEPLGDAREVMPAIATALGLTEERSRRVEDTVADDLRDQRLLLALDNFEHVLPAAAGIGELLAKCPKLLVLATSRQRLDVGGESTFPLEPLPTPPLDAPLSEADLLANPAAALFLERARNHRPKLTLGKDDVAAVATLCARLDGVPLALELAAARLKLLSPRELVSRMLGAGVLQELKGVREASQRNRSLAEVLAFSVDLLDARTRRHLSWLSVIPGPFSMADALHLAAAEKLDEGDAVAALEALTEAGMVKVSQDAADGETRFDLFVVVRELAQAQLEADGEAAAARAAHAERMLALALEAEPVLTTSEAGTWTARFERDHHQLRAAHEWLMAHNPARALELAAAVWRFWFLSARYTEAADRLGRAFRKAEKAASDEVKAKALMALARLLLALGRQEEGAQAYELGVAQARARGDRKLLAQCLYNLGYVRVALGRHADAHVLLREGREIALADKDDETVAGIEGVFGESLRTSGQEALAAASFREQLSVASRIDQTRGKALAHYGLTLCAVQQGETAEATKHARELLELVLVLADLGYLPTDLSAAARGFLLEHTPQGDERAGLLLAGVLVLPQDYKKQLDPLDLREVEIADRDVKARLGDGLDRYVKEARRLTWRELVQRVLGD
jgi:serine/threonine-protein kinase